MSTRRREAGGRRTCEEADNVGAAGKEEENGVVGNCEPSSAKSESAGGIVSVLLLNGEGPIALRGRGKEERKGLETLRGGKGEKAKMTGGRR